MEKPNTRKVDRTLIKRFFADEEAEKENTRLYNLLVDTIVSSTIFGRTILITFVNNINVCIEYYDEDYKLTISDLSLYEYDDTPHTRLSKDRILHYLDYIANVAGSGFV